MSQCLSSSLCLWWEFWKSSKVSVTVWSIFTFLRNVTRMTIASIYCKEKLLYCQSNEKILSSYCCSNVTEKLMLKIINFTNCCALFVSATQLDNHCHDLSRALPLDLIWTSQTEPGQIGDKIENPTVIFFICRKKDVLF